MMKPHVVRIRGERRWYEADRVFTAIRSSAHVFKSRKAAQNHAIAMPVACDVIEVDGEADR